MKTKPKPKLIVLLCLPLILAAGCSGLQAKSDTAKVIAADAVAMKARISSTQPTTDLAANAVEFRKLYDGATVNPWPYLFGGKTIYCTAKIYSDLQGMAVRAEEYSTRSAAATTQPTLTVNTPLWLQLESNWADVLERERTGK